MGGNNWRRDAMKRQMAEESASAARRARCVDTCIAWNERLARRGDPDPSPLLGTALLAGFRYFQVVCPNCRTIGEVDLATLDRHPETPLYGLMPLLACKRCPGAALMPKPVALSVATMRERAVR